MDLRPLGIYTYKVVVVVVKKYVTSGLTDGFLCIYYLTEKRDLIILATIIDPFRFSYVESESTTKFLYLFISLLL